MALQIRGEQLTGIKNASIDSLAGINLSKLSLSDGSVDFSGDLTFSGANTHSGNNTFSGSNTHSGILSVTNSTDSTSHADGSLIVSGGVGIAKKLYVNSDADISGALTVDGAATVGGSLTITGDLQVDGTTTTINSTELTVDDKNIIVASGSANSAAADGAGLTIDTGEANESDIPQLTWDATNSEFNFNKALRLDSSLEVDSNITSYGGNLSILDGSNVTKFSVTASNGAVVVGSLSDGTASMQSGSMSGLVNVTASGQVEFGTLSDGSVSLGGFVPATISGAGQTLENYDNDTTVPTTAAIIDYVGSKTSSTSLDLSQRVDGLSIELDTNNKISIKDAGIENAFIKDGVIANIKLVNDSVTIGTTEIDLGASSTVLAGLTSVTSTDFVGDLTGDVTGQVSDITNHSSGDLSDISYANALAQGDMLMVNSSGSIENVYEVIKYVDIDMTAGKGESQAVSLDVDHDDDYESKAMVFLNGQKLRYGADSSTNDFYFSAAGTITFQASTLASGDSLEIRYFVAS